MRKLTISDHLGIEGNCESTSEVLGIYRKRSLKTEQTGVRETVGRGGVLELNRYPREEVTSCKLPCLEAQWFVQETW